MVQGHFHVEKLVNKKPIMVKISNSGFCVELEQLASAFTINVTVCFFAEFSDQAPFSKFAFRKAEKIIL